jgi:hypothetical protein
MTLNELRNIVKKNLSKTLESLSSQRTRVEDDFNINNLTKPDVRSIAIDLSAFIPSTFDSPYNEDGTSLINEEVTTPMPIGELRKRLKDFGFKRWQITSKIECNKVRIVILYADMAHNTEFLANLMKTFGWIKSTVSVPKPMYGTTIRTMSFDPIAQKPLTKEARQYKYMYHWTPYQKVTSIMSAGLEPRNENLFLSYLPKVHLMKGDITKEDAAKLGWTLFNRNFLAPNGNYVLLRIGISKVPDNIDFYGDPRFKYGYYTTETIPAPAIDIFGAIQYKDRYNFNNEQICVMTKNDTMI